MMDNESMIPSGFEEEKKIIDDAARTRAGPSGSGRTVPAQAVRPVRPKQWFETFEMAHLAKIPTMLAIPEIPIHTGFPITAHRLDGQ